MRHISEIINELYPKYEAARENMKVYVVSSDKGWFLVKAKTERLAKLAGVNEWGTGTVVWVRLATRDEARGVK